MPAERSQPAAPVVQVKGLHRKIKIFNALAKESTSRLVWPFDMCLWKHIKGCLWLLDKIQKMLYYVYKDTFVC